MRKYFIKTFAKSYCRSLQISLAGGTFLQMDKTTFENQILLWDIRERGKDTNLDSDLDLCSDCDRSKKAQFKAVTLHNSTDFERSSFRKNAYFTGICGESLCS